MAESHSEKNAITALALYLELHAESALMKVSAGEVHDGLMRLALMGLVTQMGTGRLSTFLRIGPRPEDGAEAWIDWGRRRGALIRGLF